MASQLSPSTENRSPAPGQSPNSHAQRLASDAAEDGSNQNDEIWSDEDGEDEEGPKRKRARPLSVFSMILVHSSNPAYAQNVHSVRSRTM